MDAYPMRALARCSAYVLRDERKNPQELGDPSRYLGWYCPMTKLERRDRRRARRLLFVDLKKAHPYPSLTAILPFVAAALKREREDAGFAAVNYLFTLKAERAKAVAETLGLRTGSAKEQKKGKR